MTNHTKNTTKTSSSAQVNFQTMLTNVLFINNTIFLRHFWIIWYLGDFYKLADLNKKLVIQTI